MRSANALVYIRTPHPLCQSNSVGWPESRRSSLHNIRVFYVEGRRKVHGKTEKEKRERKDHERMQALKDIETKKQQLHEERHSNSIEYDPQYDNEINNSDNVNIESIEEEDMDRNVDGFGAEGPTQM